MSEATKKQPNVIVFSTPTCGYCSLAKRYFRQHNIRFRDVDVSRDAAAAPRKICFLIPHGPQDG